MALQIDRPNNDVFLWGGSTDISSANTANLVWNYPAPCNGRIVAWFVTLKSSINNDNGLILSTTTSGLGTAIAGGGSLNLVSVGSSAPPLTFRSDVTTNTPGATVREGDTIQIGSSQNSSNAAQANWCIVIRR